MNIEYAYYLENTQWQYSSRFLILIAIYQELDEFLVFHGHNGGRGLTTCLRYLTKGMEEQFRYYSLYKSSYWFAHIIVVNNNPLLLFIIMIKSSLYIFLVFMYFEICSKAS